MSDADLEIRIQALVECLKPSRDGVATLREPDAIVAPILISEATVFAATVDPVSVRSREFTINDEGDRMDRDLRTALVAANAEALYDDMHENRLGTFGATTMLVMEFPITASVPPWMGGPLTSRLRAFPVAKAVLLLSDDDRNPELLLKDLAKSKARFERRSNEELRAAHARALEAEKATRENMRVLGWQSRHLITRALVRLGEEDREHRDLLRRIAQAVESEPSFRTPPPNDADLFPFVEAEKPAS